MTSKLLSGLLLACVLVAPPLVSSQDFLLAGFVSIFESSAGIFKYFPSSGRWQKLPIRNLYIPTAVTYDPVRDRIIWTDALDDVVYSAHADGRDKKVVTRYEDDDVAIRGLQYDWSTGLLFYTRQKNTASNSAGKLIVRHIDTGKEVELLSLPYYAPNELSLDHDDKNIFYSNPLYSRVERANFDISNRTAFVTSEHVETPLALHYDDDNRYLYVCDFKDQGNNVTQCTRFTWGGGTSYGLVMGQTRVSYIEGVGDQLYYSDTIKEELRVITYGQNSESRRVAGQPLLGFPTGLYYHKTNYRTYANPCETARCGENELCVPTSHSDFSCLCTTGATCDDEPAVVEDECLRDDHGCEHHCRDTEDSYYCSCRVGYTLQSDGRSCQDVDECREGRHRCAQECSNSEGSFSCGCRRGFSLAPNRQDCIELDRNVNECRDGTAGCEHDCVDTSDSYYCTCRAGYRLQSNRHSCKDINECQDGIHACSQECSNTAGSYVCRCLRGFVLASNRRDCVATTTAAPAVQTCASGNGGCQHNCRDSSSGYYCTCRPGYRLMSNKHNCLDINECQDGIHACSQECSNTAGSYVCRCLRGFVLASNRRDCVASATEAPAPSPPGPSAASGSASDCHGPDLSNPDRFMLTYNVQQGLVYTDNSAGAPLRRGTIRGVRVVGVSAGRVSLAVFTPDPAWGAVKQTLRSLTTIEITSRGLQTFAVNIAVRDNDRIGMVVDRNVIAPVGFGYAASYSGFKTNPTLPLTSGESVSFQLDASKVFAINFCYEFSGSPDDVGPSAIDECADGTARCEHDCHDTRESYYCTCRPRYRLGADGYSCSAETVNECAEGNGGCDHDCHDTSSGYYCTCRTGYSLDPDDHSCTTTVGTSELSCTAEGGVCMRTCFSSVQRGTCRSGYSCCVPGSCGGHYTGSSGDLLSPNFPLNYTTHLLCIYAVNAPSGFLKFTVEYLRTEDDKDCSRDYVAILDGYGPQVARICGDFRTYSDLTFMVAGPTAVVTFASDHSVENQGFHITYQSQTCNDVGGTCAGSCSHGAFSSPLGCTGGRQCCQPAALYPQCSEPPPMVGMIVGGSEAERHSWPWQVSVQAWEQVTSQTHRAAHFCAGVLVDPSWVLTAAHCVDDQNSVEVVGGEHDISDTDGNEHRVRIHSNTIRIHPDYQRANGNKAEVGDIALIKLPRPVPLSSRLYPVCLTSQAVTFTERDECWVTGWGSTTTDGSLSRVLREVQLNLVPLDECRQLYNSASRAGDQGHQFVNDDVICAGGQGKDACDGDSGGPLVCRKSSHDKYHVVGVTSGGTSLGCGTLPTIYSSVTSYRDWILMHTLNS